MIWVWRWYLYENVNWLKMKNLDVSGENAYGTCCSDASVIHTTTRSVQFECCTSLLASPPLTEHCVCKRNRWKWTKQTNEWLKCTYWFFVVNFEWMLCALTMNYVNIVPSEWRERIVIRLKQKTKNKTKIENTKISLHENLLRFCFHWTQLGGLSLAQKQKKRPILYLRSQWEIMIISGGFFRSDYFSPLGSFAVHFIPFALNQLVDSIQRKNRIPNQTASILKVKDIFERQVLKMQI